MKFKEYVEKSKETMIYPTEKELISCMTLGIIEEYAEVEEEIGYHMFAGNTYHTKILAELGDLCFYVFNLCDHFDYVPYNETGECFTLEIHAPKLAQVIKKVIRDDNYKLTNKKRADTFYWLMECAYSYILYVCEIHDFKLSEVLQYNVDKLQGRKKRNTIGGDGDR